MQKRDLLLLLTLTLALPTAHLTAQDRSPLQFGITLGGGVVMEEGGMEHLGFGVVRGTAPNTSFYFDNKGVGLGLFAGLSGSIDIDDHLRLETTVEVERRGATYELREPIAKVLLPNDNDPANSAIVEQSRSTLLHTTFTSLSGVLGLSYHVLTFGQNDLRLCAGVSTGVALEGVERGEIREDPKLEEAFDSTSSPAPPSSRSSPAQPIENLSSLIFGLQGGLSLDIPLTDRLTLVPSAFYRYPLTEVVPDSDWRSRVIGGAVDLMWRL